jgi:sugar lactone lactonase YvrE
VRVVILVAAIVAGGAAPAAAQAPARAQAQAESARFTRLSVEDGLSQSSVLQILQDRKGLIWFGTQEGLNRYDGYRFTVHRAREQDGFLRDHEINALIEDDRGLWVGTSRGLYRHELDTGRFEKCAPPVDDVGIVELIQSGDGRIVFATSDGRLWTLDPADANRRARALNDGAFAALSNVTALAAGSGSTIWAAAQGRLFRLDLDHPAPRVRLMTVLEDVGTVSVMTLDRRGDLWLGRIDDDLVRYRPTDGRLDRFPRVPRYTLALFVGKGGEVWIGARAGGLSRLDPVTGSLTIYRHDPENPASLSGDDGGERRQSVAGVAKRDCRRRRSANRPIPDRGGAVEQAADGHRGGGCAHPRRHVARADRPRGGVRTRRGARSGIRRPSTR